MVMSHEDGLLERRCTKETVSAATRVWWLALAALPVGCGAQPSVDDSVVSDAPAATTTESSSDRGRAAPQASQDCQGARTPITNPGSAVLDTLDRLAGSYPIGGAWGVPEQLDFTPKEMPFEGELVVSRRDGDLVRVEGCSFGIEVPVAVSVRTNDGALAERVDGVVLLTNAGETTVDGAPAPFRAELLAFIDLGALSGSFAYADDPTRTFGIAALRAELTPFGTRGKLSANIEPREPSDTGSSVAQPAVEPLLTWHGGDGCVGGLDSDVDAALFPAPTEGRAALDAALEMASAETYRVKHADGTETQLAVEFAPLTLLCATDFWASYWHFPTRVHLRTGDGRLDVSIGVGIDPGFSQLHYNQLTEVPWAYPPSRVDEQIGHVDVDVAEYAHVGIEAWFDLTPEPAGWIKVLGYDDGACDLCDENGGCIECAFDQRIEILNLFIGAQAEKL
jgi:hypothetical protein